MSGDKGHSTRGIDVVDFNHDSSDSNPSRGGGSRFLRTESNFPFELSWMMVKSLSGAYLGCYH